MVLRCFKEVSPDFSIEGVRVDLCNDPHVPHLSYQEGVWLPKQHYIIGIHNQSEPRLNRGPG